MSPADSRQLVAPVRQRVWGWPALANFLLGGAGAGLCVVCFLLGGLRPVAAGVYNAAACKLLGPLLIILGFMSLTLEAGRPGRGRFLVRNLRRSWMSVEVFAGSLFIIFSFACLLSPLAAFGPLSVIAALVFMTSQGFILSRAKAVAAWNVFLVPVFFVTSGLSSGVGLLVLLSAFGPVAFDLAAPVFGLASLAINHLVWLAYCGRLRREAMRKVEGFSDIPVSLKATEQMLHVIPLFFYLLLIIRPAYLTEALRQSLTFLTGLMVLASAARQKAALGSQAFCLRGIAIGRVEGNRKARNS